MCLKVCNTILLSNKQTEFIQKGYYPLFTAYIYTPIINFKYYFIALMICVAPLYIFKYNNFLL